MDGRLPSFEGATKAADIRHDGELLGALTLTKPPNEPLTPAEEKLVSDLAAQAGLILLNFRLIEDLRASRQRLVAAQDEERRRLERNLHDGAQQQLVALAVQLRLARSLASRDPEKADSVLDGLEEAIGSALEELRDLARGIYPPLLADQGLVAALTAHVRRVSVPVAVQADAIGRFPQEVEAAVYFCVLEGLQNVSKYAAASHATVRVQQDEEGLSFAVMDDGRGFDATRTPHGMGLQNMEDRLAALGGALHVRSRPGEGTTIEGWIPATATVVLEAEERVEVPAAPR
jgi:signal transduction histidine kinase